MAVIPSQDYWRALTSKDFTVFSSGQVQMLLASEMDEKNALKILKHLAQTVTQGVCEGFHYDDNVLISVKYLLEFIQTETSNIDSSILSCVYFVSKYFLKKGEVRMVLELKPFMKSLKVEITEDVLKVYYGFFYELFSFLKQQKRTLCLNTILKIRYDSLDVLSLCHIKYLDVLLSEANKFVYGEETINEAQCLKYGIHFLKEAKRILKGCTIIEKCDTICSNYIQFVTSLLNNILVAKNGDLVAEVLNDVECFQTSDGSSNKIVFFYINSVKAVLDPNLPVKLIQQQTSALKHLIQQESISVLVINLHRFANVLTSVQGYWLSSRTEPLSVEEFMAVSELSILVSSYLKDYIQNKHPSLEQSFTASLSLRVIVNIISLGINIVLEVNNITDKEPSADVYKVLKQLSAVQTYSYELLVVIRRIDDNIWMNLWKMLAVKSAKLASVLQYRGCIKHASEFYEQFWCGFFALEPLLNIKDGIITSEDCIYKALKGLTQCFVHQSKYEEALICIGIAVLLAPRYCDGLKRSWISTKQESLSKNNIDLQNFLITNIFSKQKITMVFPNAFIKLYGKKDNNSHRLLYWELSSYTLNGVEMRDAIYNVGTQLMDSSIDPLGYIEGITLFLSILYREYDESSALFSEAYEKAVRLGKFSVLLIPNTLKWYLFTLLGNLHYYYFLAQVTALRKKLQDDVADKKDAFCSKVNRNLMKGFIDPSEAEIKSNIFTIYSGLNVEKEQDILNKLVQALDSWTIICNCEESDIQPLEIKFDELLKNVKISAQAFALYGYPEYSLRAWMTYYKLCKSSGNSAASLYSLSQLLKFSSNTDDFELWKEADKLENEIQNNNDTKKKEMLFSYFLTKSRCCLLNNEYEIGWQYLQKVNESSTSSSYGQQLIFAQKYLLLSQYYMHQLDFTELPDNFDASNAFVANIKGLKILQTLHAISTTDCLFEKWSLHLMMMEAAEWTGNLCFGMKLYRDGYAHLKSYLTCAQILGLASRCSLLVSKLAQFDLLCQELENAEVKAYGLEAILCLRNICSSSGDRVETQPPCENFKEISNILCLDGEIARMKLLDVPSPVPANFMGSPELVKTPFKMPFIMKHKENCQCLFCHSLLLQTSLVELALIKAQLHILKGENDLALSYFKGGMNLCERLKDMQKKLLCNLSITIHGKISNSYFVLFDPLLSARSKLSLAYGEFLFLTRHYESVQQVTSYSLESLLQSQECNFHIALDVIDKTQALFTEMNKTLPIDQTVSDDEKEDQALDDVDRSSVSPRIMKTPKSDRDCLISAPRLNRNNDHLCLLKTSSPSLVLKLDEKLKSNETENDHKKNRNKEGKKILACINFNDSSVNDCILETIEKGKSFESESVCGSKNTLLNVSPSSDEITPKEEQEIEILSKRIENIGICASQSSTRKTRNARRGESKAFNANSNEDREASHSIQNLKSKSSSKVNQISESENTKPSLLLHMNRKEFKSPVMDSNERNGSCETEVSPVVHTSCQRIKNTIKKESTIEKSNRKTNTKTKPKMIIYTDSSDSEFVSPDIPVKPSENTYNNLNLKSECCDIFEREELVNPKQRITRNVTKKENSLMNDNLAKSTLRSSQRNNSKITKKTHKVPVITLKSESDNSPEEECIEIHNDNCLSADVDVTTHDSSPECIFEGLKSPERKPTLRKYERKTAVPLEMRDSKHTPANVKNGKTVAKMSVKKGVTRKKRNPYVL